MDFLQLLFKNLNIEYLRIWNVNHALELKTNIGKLPKTYLGGRGTYRNSSFKGESNQYFVKKCQAVT